MLKQTFAAILATTAAFGTVATLSAQDAPAVPGVTDPARVAAGSYALDAAHTQVQWQVSHFGFNDYFGLFGDIEGTMQLDPANLDATVLDVTIPITSVAVSSSGLRDHLLRDAKDGASPISSAPSLPRPASYRSDVRRIDATRAAIFGTLTMNDKSGPVTLLAEFSGAGANPRSKVETVGFHATASIMRSEWGIDFGVPLVGDEVALEISAAFEKQ